MLWEALTLLLDSHKQHTTESVANYIQPQREQNPGVALLKSNIADVQTNPKHSSPGVIMRNIRVLGLCPGSHQQRLHLARHCLAVMHIGDVVQQRNKLSPGDGGDQILSAIMV